MLDSGDLNSPIHALVMPDTAAICHYIRFAA